MAENPVIVHLRGWVAFALMVACWFFSGAILHGPLDPRQFGASGSTQTATGCTSSGAVLTCTGGVADFQVNQYIALSKGGSAYSLNAPSGLSVSQQGGGSGTNYYYSLVPIQGTSSGTPLSAVSVSSAATLGTAKDLGAVSEDNALFWTDPTGTKPDSYAVYEGSSATLSAMRCIGTIDVPVMITDGYTPGAYGWDDFGPTHYRTCPSWLPSNAGGTGQPGFFRGQIMSINSATNQITLTATPTTAVTSQTLYHDDTTPMQNAINYGSPVDLGCFTYNIFASLTMTNAEFNGARCGVLMFYGAGYNGVSYGTAASGGFLTGLNMNGTQMASGFMVAVIGGNVVGQGANYIRLFDIQMLSPSSMVEINNATSSFIDRVYSDTVWGFNGLLMWSNSSTGLLSNEEYFQDFLIGSMTDSYGFSTLIDGDVAGWTALDFTIQASANEIVVRNTLGTTGPTFGKLINPSVNNAWNIGFYVGAGSGQDVTVHRLYAQCTAFNENPCVQLNTGSGPITIEGGSLIFGASYSGILSGAQNLQVACDTMIFANAQANSATANQNAKIALTSAAGPSVLCAANGDKFSSTGKSSNSTENYGIWLPSGLLGAGNAKNFHISGSVAGSVGPVCGTMPTEGTYDIDGINDALFVCENKAGSISLTASQMLQPWGLGAHLYDGNETGAVTWTTPTGTQLSSQFAGVNTGSQFTMTVSNNNTAGDTITFAGGSGVTCSVSVAVGATNYITFSETAANTWACSKN